jgi:serine protease AprX
MAKIRIVFFFVIFTSGLLQAQVNRYMVFFNDKSGTPHSIANPEAFLSERSIQRRANQNISIDSLDIPVTSNYVTEVRNTGVSVLYTTRWMNGVLIECASTDTSAVRALPFVSAVEYVAPGPRPAGGRVGSSRKFKEVIGSAAATDFQISMLGMNAMHEAGFRGEGMLVAVMDAGFPGADTISFFKHIFDEGRFDATTSFNFVSGGSNVFKHNSHGTNVWSVMAGYKSGIFSGGAYKANYILFVTEHQPTEYRVEEYNWLFAAEKADSAGVDVINTSLGYTTFDDDSMDYTPSDMDGKTTVITKAAEIAASKGIAVIASAGNEGQGSPTTIGAPSDGENVLAVGGVTFTESLSSFSSIGPSADGRIKPDVVALGNGVALVGANGSIGSSNGTSFSSPLAASLVIGVWQMLPELSVKELMDTIRSRASRASVPDNLFGYGISRFDYPIIYNDSGPVSIFPNPTLGESKIKFDVDPNSSILSYELFDSRGALCRTGVLLRENDEFIINLSKMKAGLYTLRLQLENHFFVRKILKVD